MTRTIKFRGISRDTGKWLIGALISNGEKEAYIAPFGRCFQLEEVNPDTVGQFTGMLDKNGKEIYEGDIIKLMEFPDAPIYEVKWSNDSLAFCVESLPYAPAYNDWGTPVGSNLLWALENASDIEIIGNLYDNPDMLKGGKSC